MSRAFLDNLAAVRLLTLLNMNFTSWKAYELGIIDDKGKTIKTPMTTDERQSWTYLHRIIRKVKQLMDKVPGARIAASIYAIREHLTEEEFNIINEAMVAGDTVDINAGTTTGAVVGTGPETLGKKKKKMKTFDEFLNESFQFQQLMKDVEDMVKKNMVLDDKQKDNIIKRFTTVTQITSGVKERDIDRLEKLLSQL